MDFVELKRRSSTSRRLLLLAGIAAICLLIFRNSSSFSTSVKFSQHEPGVTHVLVTGGAGYIGSHATLRLLKDSYRVTIVDNLSRGNIGAVKVLQELFPDPGRLQFIYADLGDAAAINKVFSQNAFDAVMHFAAVAYVGESTQEPLRVKGVLGLLILSWAILPHELAFEVELGSRFISLSWYQSQTHLTQCWASGLRFGRDFPRPLKVWA
ncbi:putative UDP-arabinose 4-epimerase 3 [Capsicum annuum]|nr:putative UDP-arabinose 4-epimerase 3 [Capsicum annuum]